ncbi:hydroxymethylpyrimidine/phosphomethylpyrimidine kinase [Chitinophaga sp. Cy-1792]|uniref:hydroxymethylpyrimidine/phosphomethylpyrimidine kinase n=1 Tax=Chitinophaga sp. Cy-1792 TaxID=2608339 RepID=UPI001422BFB7|nr:hydroxymethylpyrimidine/phosphomethylpyrimidine kinase [Chitinophaga sp. Cy-1792]NIG52540.1 hydroxymethylpyrimidine/phosphomethylpyrimidine kinase [Chitinophaga sp. Cy-1792]
MKQDRPYALSIAGLDPSAGAGLLADIKTFEQLQVYGLGVTSAVTIQTGTRFHDLQWLPATQILEQAKPLLEEYPVTFCKIGIMENLAAMHRVITQLLIWQPAMKIILDPVLKASAGYTFHEKPSWTQWEALLKHVYLLTPNYEEAVQLTGLSSGTAAASQIFSCCHVLLKGGHHPEKPGVDTLYTDKVIEIHPGKINASPKHGSGCVLSAAITALLAKGETLERACINGKDYTEKLLSSNTGLLGYHSII